MRVFILLIFTTLSWPALAAEVLHFNCLGKYASFLKPVSNIELFPEIPNGPKVALPEAAEYYGKIPPSCGDELPASGTLRVVTVAGQLYLLDLTFKNPTPMIIKHFSPKMISLMEGSYKKTGSAGNAFLSNVDHLILLNYTIRSEEGLAVERLSYRSKLAAQYE